MLLELFIPLFLDFTVSVSSMLFCPISQRKKSRPFESAPVRPLLSRLPLVSRLASFVFLRSYRAYFFNFYAEFFDSIIFISFGPYSPHFFPHPFQILSGRREIRLDTIVDVSSDYVEETVTFFPHLIEAVLNSNYLLEPGSNFLRAKLAKLPSS